MSGFLLYICLILVLGFARVIFLLHRIQATLDGKPKGPPPLKEDSNVR